MTRTLGIHSRFGLPRLLWSSSPRRALRASIQIRGEFRTSIFKVFDCFGRHRRALTRASGFPARFSIGWLGRRRRNFGKIFFANLPRLPIEYPLPLAKSKTSSACSQGTSHFPHACMSLFVQLELLRYRIACQALADAAKADIE